MFSAQHVVETSARPLAKRSDNLWPDLKKSKPSQPTPNAKPVPPAKMQCADDEMPIPKPGKRVLEMAEENVETVARKKRKVSRLAANLFYRGPGNTDRFCIV